LRCALSILAAAAACAGAPPEAVPDTISSAKKDLAAVKALSNPAETSVAGLPAVDMKAVSPGPGNGSIDMPAPLPSGEDAAVDPTRKAEKGATGNWLVDAMDRKPDKGRSERGRESASSRDELELSLRSSDRASARAELEAQGGTEPADRDGPKQGAAFNPLESFMAGWISARDRELLLPAKRDGAADSTAARAPGEQDSGTLQGDFAVDLLSLGEMGASLEGKAEPNPYLSAMDPEPAPAPKMFVGPAALDSGSSEGHAAPVWFGSDAGPLEVPRTFIPDFARPSDDDKYFKQMKRF